MVYGARSTRPGDARAGLRDHARRDLRTPQLSAGPTVVDSHRTRRSGPGRIPARRADRQGRRPRSRTATPAGHRRRGPHRSVAGGAPAAARELLPRSAQGRRPAQPPLRSGADRVPHPARRRRQPLHRRHDDRRRTAVRHRHPAGRGRPDRCRVPPEARPGLVHAGLPSGGVGARPLLRHVREVRCGDVAPREDAGRCRGHRRHAEPDLPGDHGQPRLGRSPAAGDRGGLGRGPGRPAQQAAGRMAGWTNW